MSDIGGAAAPAESSPTPELPLDTPNPITTENEGHPEPVEKVEAEPSKPKSIDDALNKAAEKVEKDSKEAEAKAADKPTEVKTEVKRDETGKF